jgi:hypothetical protein
MYPALFSGGDLFQDLTRVHTFQDLTESTKPDKSLRKGVYITRVTEVGRPVDGAVDALDFKLLRCSTNLAGPTVNRTPVDDFIIGAVSEVAAHNFVGAAELDHVLAQVYANAVDGDDEASPDPVDRVSGGSGSASGRPVPAPTTRSRKARISAHSDKTKDMPPNGIMAFVSFYHGGAVGDPAGLSSLKWRLKEGVEPGPDLPAVVDVPLLPGSVLLVSLVTNRLYTHEVRPSPLPAPKMPTRLGYVIRCSKTRARHDLVTSTTSVQGPDGQWTLLRAPTPEDLSELRAQYFQENVSPGVVEYRSATHGPLIPYSMNGGDYLAPLLGQMK